METLNFLAIIPIGLYIILTLVISIIGNDREVGFFLTLLCCIFFTPISGALIAFASKRKSDIEFEHKLINLLENLKS